MPILSPAVLRYRLAAAPSLSGFKKVFIPGLTEFAGLLSNQVHHDGGTRTLKLPGDGYARLPQVTRAFTELGFHQIKVDGEIPAGRLRDSLRIGLGLKPNATVFWNNSMVQRIQFAPPNPAGAILQITDTQSLLKTIADLQAQLAKLEDRHALSAAEIRGLQTLTSDAIVMLEERSQDLKGRPDLPAIAVFIGRIVHDLNNLLTVTYGGIQLTHQTAEMPSGIHMALKSLDTMQKLLAALAPMVRAGGFQFDLDDSPASHDYQGLKQIKAAAEKGELVKPVGLFPLSQQIGRCRIENVNQILLLEDNPVILSTNTMALQAMGYQVTGVTKSEEAITKGLLGRSSWNLIILDLDLEMERINGFDVFKSITAGWKKPDQTLPILLCSARAMDPEVQAKARELGFSGYMLKNIGSIKDVPGFFKEVLTAWNQ